MNAKNIALLVFLLAVISVSVGFLYSMPSQSIPDKELLISMNQFEVFTDEDGRSTYEADDAKIWIAHPNENWRVDQIINNESSVAHKALIGDMNLDGKNEMYLASGIPPLLDVYNFENNNWTHFNIWKPSFTRVRDIEIGDVDNDGNPEIVAGTHDEGVVAVIDYSQLTNLYRIKKVYSKEKTYIHEVEIGDFDNDGKNEFFATASDPNVKPGMIQLGAILMFRWNGSDYVNLTVEKFKDTLSKEIVVGDIDNDGKNELVASLIGNIEPTNESADDIETGRVKVNITIPIAIKKYEFENGQIKSSVIATIEDDYKARSMLIGDIDNNGVNDLVIGTDTEGLWALYLSNESVWTKYVLDDELKGNIHAIFMDDFDGDGKNELVASSDLMSIVVLYKWNGQKWDKKTILKTPEGDWLWAMDFGNVDNK